MSQLHNDRDDIQEPFKTCHATPNRLVHLIPDELARSVPDHPLFEYAKTENIHDGFRTVTAKCLANAINRTAWYLEDLLGRAHDFPTVGYMGPRECCSLNETQNSERC